MLKSHIQSNKGSTLAMMILVIGILVILGVALLSATFVGYKAKMQDNRNKAAFYVAEAGLDEAYAYLGEEVENASQYSRKVYVATSLVNHPEDTLLGDNDYKNKVNGYFKEGYKQYFIANQVAIEDRLRDKLNKMPLTTNAHNEQIQSITATVKQNFVSGSGNNGPMQIEFKTIVLRRDEHGVARSAEQTIESVLEISIPAYDTPYYQEKKNYTIKRNALFDKALAMDGNFYVSGGNVTVNGDVFAYGRDDGTGLGAGIMIGGLNAINQWVSGNLTVNGNLDTHSDIQIPYSQSVQTSSLVVNKAGAAPNIKGDIACNALSINSSYNNGTSTVLNDSASIVLRGDAFVLDDTELNAPKSKVDIAGNYYGFSFGNTRHNESSSLIVNANDIDNQNGSTLTVSGGGLARTFTDGGVSTVVPGGVYLGGTVYVDSDGTYQTGDSISVVENYIAYSESLNMAADKFTIENGDYAKYAAIDPGNPAFKSFYGSYGPLSLIDSRKDPATGNAVAMTVEDKIKYGYYGYVQNPSKIKVGGTSQNIKVSNVQYAIGNYIDASGPSSIIKRDKGDLSPYSEGLKNIEKMYKFKTNWLSDCQIEDNYLANSNLNTYPGVQGWLKSSWKDNAATGTNSFSFNDDTLYYANNTAAGKDEVLIVRGSGDDAVYSTLYSTLQATLPPGTSIKVINLSAKADPSIKGIILSKQNVYFVGKINYEGLVVSEKDIYCMGNGAKQFTNQNTSQVGNFVTDRVIDDVLIHKTAGSIGTWFKQDDPSWSKTIVKSVDVSSVYTNAQDLGYAPSLQNAVRITSWKRTP